MEVFVTGILYNFGNDNINCIMFLRVIVTVVLGLEWVTGILYWFIRDIERQ